MSVKPRLSSGTRQQIEVLLILLCVHPYILDGGTQSGKGRCGYLVSFQRTVTPRPPFIPQHLQTNAWMLPQIKSSLLPYTAFLIHYPLIRYHLTLHIIYLNR